MSASQPALTLESLLEEARSVAGGLVNVLFPTICAACGRLGPMICDTCTEQIQILGTNVCRQCGRPSASVAKSCVFCRNDTFRLQQSRACFAFRDPLTTIIHKFKYDGLYGLAEPLGMCMARFWPEWDSPPDMIIPIPLHERRKRMRGFNQAALLAQHLGTVVHVPLNDVGLKRVRNTTPQVGLSPAERESNVRDAFSADSSELEGKHILLLDDVFTTGATMNAAAGAIIDAGAASVSAYCLALALQ